MSGFEPAAQGFRVNTELKATVSQGDKNHGDISFRSTNEHTRKRRENGKVQGRLGDSQGNARECFQGNPKECRQISLGFPRQCRESVSQPSDGGGGGKSW